MADIGVLSVHDKEGGKAIVVCGPEAITRRHKQVFKDKGGKWNPNLKGQIRKGWVFKADKKEEIKSLVSRINETLSPPASIAESRDSLTEEELSETEPGAKVSLVSNCQDTDYSLEVITTYVNNGVISMLLKRENITVTAVMVEGKWQIFNYPFKHALIFEVSEEKEEKKE